MSFRLNPGRLIPWCLAAAGFVVVFTVSAWRENLTQPALHRAGDAGQQPIPPAADHHWLRPARAPMAAGSTSARAAVTQVVLASLPDKDSEPPELDGTQPKIDDSPVVDDLPARPDPAQSESD